MDPPVIRLAHCQVQVFCLQVPGACPSCGEDLRERRLQEAPVSLPSPFSNAHKTSCCLLNHNCLSFCLSFVNRVLAAEGREALSRETFTQIFILPRVQRVQKYLFLYKHLQTHQYYLVDREEDRQEDTQEETQEGI
ncbi:MKRN2 opposite strand protein [Dissostichus eleginoides]|uniref:MKRN2 opposite strand protein n=1 Tax=Dissostichus eleginoides TaxID=100907 RepID=A0AAD9CJV0_DISEL|nr:MKRN2 opposite strand protein [Dissostichus eleginoides]KAK1901697.1 MKRN2 opposite strand protein [Dissostichus eleginoides]